MVGKFGKTGKLKNHTRFNETLPFYEQLKEVTVVFGCMSPDTLQNKKIID